MVPGLIWQMAALDISAATKVNSGATFVKQGNQGSESRDLDPEGTK
jgi:hypothetical protein